MTGGVVPLVATILSNAGLVIGLVSAVISLINSRIELQNLTAEADRTGRDPTQLNQLAVSLAGELADVRTELNHLHRHKMG